MDLDARIREVADQIADENVEWGVLLDPETGEEVARRRGEERHVDLTPPREGLVFIHNHPRQPEDSDVGRDLTFSIRDVAAAANDDVARSVVVTHESVYHLERPAGGWPEDAVVKLVGINLMVSLSGAAQITNRDAGKRDEVVRRLAEELGARYWKEERN